MKHRVVDRALRCELARQPDRHEDAGGSAGKRGQERLEDETEPEDRTRLAAHDRQPRFGAAAPGVEHARDECRADAMTAANPASSEMTGVRAATLCPASVTRSLDRRRRPARAAELAGERRRPRQAVAQRREALAIPSLAQGSPSPPRSGARRRSRRNRRRSAARCGTARPGSSGERSAAAGRRGSAPECARGSRPSRGCRDPGRVAGRRRRRGTR